VRYPPFARFLGDGILEPEHEARDERLPESFCVGGVGLSDGFEDLDVDPVDDVAALVRMIPADLTPEQPEGLVAQSLCERVAQAEIGIEPMVLKRGGDRVQGEVVQATLLRR